ncbi:MAG: alpha/beta hydrolase, partial [Acidimicrobiales bacterium]
MAQISGNPDALENFSAAMQGAFGELDGVISAYGSAVISYNSAPSDLGSCMISRAGAVSATGYALYDLDREPAAFAYALRQLDHHILPGGAYSISATSMFDALVSARLANPTLDDGALRRVAIVDMLKAALSKIGGLPPGLLEKFFAAFLPLPTDLSWTDAQVASTLEGLLGLDPGRPPGAIVQPLVPPDAVRAFVALLTSAQLDALAANHPELVGPVDGMPHELRYQANRTLIDRTLDQARLDGDAALVKTLEGLAGADRKFLFFDPAGDGRAAEVFGNLTTADDVTVFVPGITNTLANFKATSENAHRIYDEMDLRDPSGSHAAIAWLGYDTPGIVDAPLPGRAHESAPLLRQLWDGLALPDAVNTTVVAHSYGSLVAATALR